MEKFIFVYGTLKAAYGNHRCLEHPTTEFVGEIETPPIYTLYDGGFPIVEREGNTSIKGELYKVVEPSVVRSVYNLEGYSGTPGSHNHFYDVDTFETEHGTAEIFVMPKGSVGNRGTVLESGVWNRNKW